MTSIRIPNASRELRLPQPSRLTSNPKSYESNRDWSTTTMSNGMQLIHEALSRARMRRPQETTSEAPRSARQITLSARRETNRWLSY
jgi:hypothetical protein